MNPDFNTVLFAFLLTLFAGLSTGVGSTIAFFAKRPTPGFSLLAWASQPV
jgi:zinc transporter, ZIP family